MSAGQDNAFADRRKALEEEFFRKQDQKLVEQLRAKQEKSALREALVQLGAKDSEALVDALFEQSVSPRTLAAITLVPLVVVAWSDGSLEAKEKEAILQAAASLGVPEDGPGYALLRAWLDEKPPSKLLQTWETFTAALAANLSAEQRAEMKRDVVDRARRVAEAAGGFLGIVGPKVSVSEREVLARLEKAFG